MEGGVGASVKKNGRPPSTRDRGRAGHREQAGQGESGQPLLRH